MQQLNGVEMKFNEVLKKSIKEYEENGDSEIVAIEAFWKHITYGRA